MTKRKKILLIFCGGTTLFGNKVSVQSVRKKADVSGWMKNIDELKMMADIEPFFVFGGEAAEVGEKQWQKIAQTVIKNYKKYDGFVITHGLETLPYTAAALSFMLQKLGKPVILTGSPIPSGQESSAEVLESIFKNFQGLGIKANLINACQVAISDLAGVLVVFGSRILSGTAVEGLSSYTRKEEKENKEIMGKIDLGLTIYKEVKKRSSQKPLLKPEIDPKVSVFDFHPGIESGLLKENIKKEVHGLIIKTHSTNFFPDSIFKYLKKAKQKKMPVVIYSTSGFKPVKKSAFIFVDNMNLITTVVKLMWALGQTTSMGQIKKIMAKNYNGEINK
ncbi:MAG: asparaginase domain-containing protein [Patescibacteria group bacterium]|nr:asparaginase domain-containing protein [Patescibacteria group bacterium]